MMTQSVILPLKSSSITANGMSPPRQPLKLPLPRGLPGVCVYHLYHRYVTSALEGRLVREAGRAGKTQGATQTRPADVAGERGLWLHPAVETTGFHQRGDGIRGEGLGADTGFHLHAARAELSLLTR